jgi:hypothetical protein
MGRGHVVKNGYVTLPFCLNVKGRETTIKGKEPESTKARLVESGLPCVS